MPDEMKIRLANGEPMEYITGTAYFYREEYTVTPDVLIPRPETELLVERLAGRLSKGAHFVDLCCGSGCIAISALCERQDCTADAYDISEKAVAIARENARKNGVWERYHAWVGDVKELCCPACEIIVANPPYIQSEVIAHLDRSVIDYEPWLALDGGADGMDFYRIILQRFKPVDCFLFEIGYDQGEAIVRLAASLGMTCEVSKDYSGHDRIACIKE